MALVMRALTKISQTSFRIWTFETSRFLWKQRSGTMFLDKMSSPNMMCRDNVSRPINGVANRYMSDRKPDQNQRRVAIFDKDGTLTCVHSLWAPWLIDIAKRLEEETGLDALRDEVYLAMGFDLTAYKFVPGGLLSENTMKACVESIHGLLERRGISTDRAKQLANKYFVDEYRDALQNGELKEFGDVRGIFTRLRKSGFHVAVNTSDSRVIAEGTLERLGVSHLVDVVVCGDDADIKPKPDACSIIKICNHLGLQPEDAVFIGDSPTDALCGRNSKCGLVITVLTGGLDQRLLEENSDHVLDSIDDAADLILGENSQ